MNIRFVFKTLLTIAALILSRSAPAQTIDQVNGNLIQFNDNGAWTWYSDERAVVDRAGGKLLVSVDVSGAGFGGSPRNGAIDATIFDLKSGLSSRFLIKPALLHFGCDDHNVPGLLVRPDGKYLLMYSGHNNDNFSYWRIYDPLTGTWSAEQSFDWNTQPGGTDFQSSYNNLHYLPAEGRLYDFARGNGHGGQNIMTSIDQGNTFTFGGQLASNLPPASYVNGYFRYADDSVASVDGATRVDFICTEYHPRNFNNSIYHGYVSNGMDFKTDGTVVDANIFDKVPYYPQNFQLMFQSGTVMPPGQTNYRCWNDDVQRYPDGTIQAIITARINNNVDAGQTNDTLFNTDHSFIFCRWNGSSWTSTYLCRGGYKMYSSEVDYVGLGCLNPNDPNTIYISTIFDPRTDQTNSAVHEIWKGSTTNHGASFQWTPLTQKSTRDNFRPIMPAWNGNNSALFWFRGSYASAQSYNAAPVGLVDRHSEFVGKMHYVDATTNNTTLTNGTALVLSASSNRWHSIVGAGNGGTLMSSADSVVENASNLVTRVTAPEAGTYDVWVNFWGLPSADWRIKAGLTVESSQTYRTIACKQVQLGDHDTVLVTTNIGATVTYLYQAYVGRVVLSNTLNIDVLVDDNPIQTGGNGTNLISNTARTSYDGISYAKVNPFQIADVTYNAVGPAVTITWNSIPPQQSLTTPTYTVSKKDALTDLNWVPIATGIPSAGATTSYVDTPAGGSAAFYRVTWP